MRKKSRRHRSLFREVVILALALLVSGFFIRTGLTEFYRRSYPLKYSDLVEKVCTEKGLEPALIYAVIRTESSFNPQAVGPVTTIDARGLMQVTSDAFDWVRMRQGQKPMDPEMLFEPEVNIDCGSEMLRMFLDEFDFVENALCAYHAGRTNAMKWLADPEYAPDGKIITNIPFGDTAAYVHKVCKTMEIYQELYDM